jgi:hypothetical protein
MTFKNSAYQNGIVAIRSLRMVLMHSKHKLLSFVENAEKPGDFLCRKPPQKY